MGRGFIEYQLPESGRDECVLFSAFIHYRFEDATRLHIEQDPAWCSICRCFVVAECLPPIEQLEIEIDRLMANDPELLQIWAFVSDGAPVQDRLAELRKRLIWRKKRSSSARCLHCGSVEVTPIPYNGEFSHPRTGERVIAGGSGWAVTECWAAEFSPEGVLLAGRQDPADLHD